MVVEPVLLLATEEVVVVVTEPVSAFALRLNAIYDFELSDISISRAGGATSIRIAYERRMPLLANIDIVAVFDHVSQ